MCIRDRDYMGPKGKEDKSEKIDSLPILVGVDGLKWNCAHMVPNKGLDPHAIKMVTREIKLSGYSRILLKSDQEPSYSHCWQQPRGNSGRPVKWSQRNPLLASTSPMDRWRMQSEQCKGKFGHSGLVCKPGTDGESKQIIRLCLG